MPTAHVKRAATALAARLDGSVTTLAEPLDRTGTGPLAAALRASRAVVAWSVAWTPEELAGRLEALGVEHGTLEALPGGGTLACLFADEADVEPVAEGVGPRAFRVLAILPVFNEADVIDAVLSDLIAQGLEVYVIDHASTDDTAARARALLGRGVVRVESFPGDAGFPERNEREMVWRDILRRVEQVADEQQADWYVFTNGDEFREAPWPRTTLAEGLRTVDELGFTAVNFAVVNFHPTDDGFVPGTDPRAHLVHHDAGGTFFDHLQVKAWKRPARPARLVATGGHSVDVPDRRVFPVDFILRHYPLRGATHGLRKVHAERLARFAADERAEGWHVQYDELAAGRRELLRDPATLQRYDGDAIRAELLWRALRRLLLLACARGHDLADGDVDPRSLGDWLRRRTGEDHGDDVGAVGEAQATLRALLGGAVTSITRPGAVAGVAELAAAQAAVRGDALLARRLDEVRDHLEQAA